MENDFQYLHAIVPNDYYHNESVFEKEQELIFKNSWYYVCTTLSLENHNDFVTIEIGGVSVVVQNFRGVYKAYHNICTHRFNKIQNEQSGNRALICQYHGWNYNADGVPYGIPLKKEFTGLDDAALKKICLKNFDLEVCGKFVFVKITPSSISLEEYLGGSKERILQISAMLGRKIEYYEIPNEANWKIVMENTLEGYHISTVHPNTFYKLGFNLKSTMDTEIHGLHSNMTLSLGDTSPNPHRDKFHTMIKQRPFQPDGFFHQIIFPNLTIGSAWGVTVYIGTIKALNANQSIFAYDLFETNLGDGKLLNDAISGMVNFSAIEFTHTTLAEDKAICESVHKGMKEKNENIGILSNTEIRIIEFQKAYLKQMQLEV
ncbi:MAG: aromatic ring-hydroxylating dioxygenase subunit alpha [Bacteroidota bacterium]